MSNQQNKDEEIGADEPVVGAANASKKADYKIGRGRPPEEYKWRKGQSGNLRGRPRKKQDKKAIIEQMMSERIVIREDGEEHQVTKYDALFRSHLAKGIKGDARSAKLVMDEATRLSLGDERDSAISALLPQKIRSVQSDALFADVDLDLLSNEDKVELARCGEIIDLGGDFRVLSAADFARIKQITDKGRGKDVTPRVMPVQSA